MSKSRNRASNYPPGVTGSEPQITGEEEAPRSDVQVTPNGDAVYVPQADVQAGAPSRPEKPRETKRERFKRLLGRRLPKAVKVIEQLIPLAGKAQYESSESQREFLLARLNEAVLKVQSAFSNTVERVANMVIPD